MEASYRENFEKQLQRLLHAVRKSRNKYQEAYIESPEVKNLFDNVITERETIESELITEIKALNSSADVDAYEFSGNKASKSGGHSEQSVLEKIRGTDRELLEAYDDVLQGTILESVHLKAVLSSQRFLVNEAFTKLDAKYFSLFKTKGY